MTNQAEIKIEFISAEAKSENSVEAKYKLSGTEFSVEWCNINEATRKVDEEFYLIDGRGSVISDDIDTILFIEEELSKEEDSEIYLFVRDTFNASQAKDLADELIEPQVVARGIGDFDFEAGSAGGIGEYTADIQIGAKEFSVDLYYEYFYNDNRGFGSLPAWVVGESDGAELETFSKIEIAAARADIELDEDTIYEIIGELESQVEFCVEGNYSASVSAIQESFEERQEELRKERDEECGMSM